MADLAGLPIRSLAFGGKQLVNSFPDSGSQKKLSLGMNIYILTTKLTVNPVYNRGTL